MAKRIQDSARPLVVKMVQHAVLEGGFEPRSLQLRDDAVGFDPAVEAATAEPGIVLRAEVKGVVDRKGMFAVVVLRTLNQAWVPSFVRLEVEPRHQQDLSLKEADHQRLIEDADLLAFVATIGQQQN